MILFSFVETPTFTRKIVDLLSDDELAAMQVFLCENPDFGKLLKGSGGICKTRWSAKGKGKSGGIRVLYYWQVARDRLLLLDVHSKSEKESLTDSELKSLRKIVSEYE